MVNYLLFKIKNQQAAVHLLNGVERLYGYLENNPFQFPLCRDSHLSYRGYREAILTEMNYFIIYKVEEHCVYVLGIFHELEQYNNKL